MENLRIKTSNDFSESFEQFQDTNLFNRLIEKYKVKPFFERYKTLRNVSAGASYFINLFSAITAFTCVFVFLDTLIHSRIIAGFLTALFLFGIEAFKRLTIPDFFKNLLQFRKVNFFKLLCITGLVAVSVSLSYMGANDAVKMFSPDAVVTNVDSLTAPFMTRIETLEKQLKDIKKTQSWKGKLTKSGQQAYNRTNEQIAQLQAKVLDIDTHTRDKNELSETMHDEKIISVAWIFALFTIALDSVLLLLLWFLEFYDFRSLAEFAEPEAAKVDTRKKTTQSNSIFNDLQTKKGNGLNYNEGLNYNNDRPIIQGFVNRSGTYNDDRNNDNRNNESGQNIIKIQHGTGICKQCNKAFTKNAPKHIYCSNECRVLSWEHRTGKNLKRTKAKKQDVHI